MYLSPLPKGTIIIDDDNAWKYCDPHVGDREFSKGYIQRDWDKEPFGSNPYAKAFDLPLIPRSEWADRIEEMERTKSSLTDMAIRRGVKISNQNGVGYCWIFAVVKAQEMARVAAGLPHVPLSPASVGAPIKNFRNQGGWCSEGLEYVVKHGTIPESHWPEHSLSRSHDNPEANALRVNYKVSEFYDVVNIRGQRPAQRFERLMTCLLLGFPVACGHNWWGHAICHATPKVIGNNQYGVEIWNSWTANWGNSGRSILAESKATPDDAVAVRVATAA